MQECIEHEQIQPSFSPTEIIIAYGKLKKYVQTFSNTFPNISAQGRSQTKQKLKIITSVYNWRFFKAVYEVFDRESKNLFLMLQIALKTVIGNSQKIYL